MAKNVPIDPKFSKISVGKRREHNKKSRLCSALLPKKRGPRTSRLVAIIDDFFKCSSIHGVRYIGKGTLGPWDNFVWFVLVMICGGVTLWFTIATLERYQQAPTEIVVANSALPLWSFPFPAVTVCPSEKMEIPLAESIIRETILNSTSLNFSDWSLDFNTNANWTNFSFVGGFSQKFVDDIIKILVRSEFPRVGALKPALERLRRVQHLLPIFGDMNITKFMLDVMPPCHALFRVCFWSGQPYECCELFQLQRTEVGFCYSFNSLTSEERASCDDDPDSSELGETSSSRKGLCTLRRTASSGPGSALLMYLRIPPDFDDAQTHLAQVTVGSPRDLPEPQTGFLVPATPGATVHAPVSYQYTASASILKKLPEAQRGCILASERTLRISRFYSRRSCIFECRQDYIKSLCGCLPYPYITPGLGRECHLEDYFCVANVSGHLQFFTPPRNVPGFTESEYRAELNCSHCVRTCQVASYRMSAHTKPEPAALHDACVDVFFEGLNSAVLYRHKVVFTIDKLLVSLGGVANLFLGISYLSLLEVIVFIIKLCFAMRSNGSE